MADRPLRAVTVAALAAGLVAATGATAAPSPTELAAARKLFAEAEKDEDAGRWADALDKLRRVAEVRATAGVRYHVALCEEALGHLGAALDDFTAAQAQARTDRATDVLATVSPKIDEVTARVPRVAVRVLPAGVAATVTLDDAPVLASDLATPLRVDPGVHHLHATAPDRTPADLTLTVRERDVTSADLALGELPLAPPPPPPPPPARASAAAPATAPSHATAIVATAGAAVLAAGGVGAFVAAANAVTSGTAQCASQHAPCDAQKTVVRALDATALVAWVGAAGVGTWAVLLWTRPSAAGGETSLVVGPAWAAVRGSF